MKTILFLIRIGSICFIGFWTIAGFFALVIATNVNSAYWGMTVEPYFFGIHNTLFFFLIAVPGWTVIYFLYKFYKKFDWNDDLIYLYFKTITKDYIGILYERYSKQKNDSTIIQSLLGRGTGYNVPQGIIIYTNIPTVEKFKLLWENRFENFDEVGWISNTTKGKKTFADPSLTGFESDISSDFDSTLSESEDDFAYKIFEENERFTNFKEFVKNYFLS